ncbi:nucleotidyltransferase family protein [Paenibacillus sp. E194]|uniref:nucleotidyltransferase family protein n=1 Tax=Paenibacillus sp. E194 TaxID=1458845 RepID=UPI000A553877|nr:nucleotidyltransferase family protein [Paenibacillus sp. E194]
MLESKLNQYLYDFYASTLDALRRWPETATAIWFDWMKTINWTFAAYGLEDLFELIVR